MSGRGLRFLYTSEPYDRKARTDTQVERHGRVEMTLQALRHIGTKHSSKVTKNVLHLHLHSMGLVEREYRSMPGRLWNYILVRTIQIVYSKKEISIVREREKE